MNNQERMLEVLQQPASKAVYYFNYEFGCPPFNKTFDNYCRKFLNCHECWENWLKSEVE